MRQNYQKQEWTNADRDLLTTLTEQYRLNQLQIDWVKIASQMNKRTDRQCKSYYANIIKPKLNIESRENHMWSKLEILSLWVFGVNYNADFVIIKNQYSAELFKDLTIKQMQSQWHQIVKKQKHYYELFKTILQNPVHIETLTQKEFVNTSQIVRIAYNRRLLIDLKFFQRQTCVIDDKGRPLDMMEIKAIEQFFLDLNINALREIYIKEHERRGIEDSHEHI
ncbi:SANT/Myb_domain [Hexamita inflata]|uniref:SANT/Myb domain n=1 Tax=Hexamita inflata TaxID=28002 RepID=A0AA86UNR4_9EUKA|nr:SANT/Myb domain [Hexamita inflata]